MPMRAAEISAHRPEEAMMDMNSWIRMIWRAVQFQSRLLQLVLQA
jgi:hypothetical protein